MSEVAAPRTIPQVVAAVAAAHGDAEGLVDGDRRWTFAELADEVDRYARALVASGVEPGDRIAVWAHNCAEWAFAALGAHTAGATVGTPGSPMPPGASPDSRMCTSVRGVWAIRSSG